MNKKLLALSVFASFGVAFAATTGNILPSGEGSYLAWTPKSGTTHYTMVDEATCNGTTDYVSTTVAGSRDAYAVSLASIPDGSTITAISLVPCASKNKSSGTSAISLFYRLNGVDSANGAAYAPTGTTPVALATTTFSGLSITKNASTTLQSGVVFTSGTAGARLGRLATVITYSAPAVPPTAPTSLNAFASSTVINTTWVDTSSNELGFGLERSTDGISYALIATTTANATFKADFGAATGTMYYYRVYAFNAYGNSGYSNVATATRP